MTTKPHWAYKYKRVVTLCVMRQMIAVHICTYRLVMISIERSETAQKSALEIQDKFSLRKNAV